MKKLSNPYLIQFAGLKNGEHIFDYVIDDSFFKGRKYSEIQQANIRAHITLTKETHLLIFLIKLEGSIRVMCDRCGDYFYLPVWGENKLIASLTNDRFENENDIVSIPIDSSEIDIAQFLYEYIAVLLPQRRIHPDNGCNAESLKILGNLSKKEKENHADPRWEQLRKIKTN